MRAIITFFIILLSALAISAQEMRVVSLEPTAEIMRVENQRRDLNGEICALVKVELPVSGAEFDKRL